MCVFLLHKRCEVLVQRLNTAGRKDLKGPCGSPRGFLGAGRGAAASRASLRPPSARAGRFATGKLRSRPARPALRCPASKPLSQSGQHPSPPWSGLLGTIPGPLPCGRSRLCFEMTDKVINCKANSENPSQARVRLWICLRPGKPTEKGLESSRALQPAPAEGPGGAGAA